MKTPTLKPEYPFKFEIPAWGSGGKLYLILVMVYAFQKPKQSYNPEAYWVVKHTPEKTDAADFFSES